MLDVRRFEGEQAARNNEALQKLFDELPHKTREQKLRDALDALSLLHGVNPPARSNQGRAATAAVHGANDEQ